MEYQQLAERELRSSKHKEMQERSSLRETFFSLKRESQSQRRPTSVATEFVDTDWDDDDILSDPEEPLENSPRHSLRSAGQRSITTLSSYDEASTPRSSRGRMAYPDVLEDARPVEGPRGPHLFRSSTTSSFDEEHVLTLSPITPKAPTLRSIDDTVLFSPDEELASILRACSRPLQFTREDLDNSHLVSWSPEMVAQSMLNAGVDFPIAEKFIENDINGSVLITLKFEDLKELRISSFGVRTKIWNQILVLRDSRPSSPQPPTPIEDAPSKEVQRQEDRGLKGRQSSKRRPGKPSIDEIITPMESVSIVGIEQVIPKPHVCPKGEKCVKYKKQKRLIEAFKKEHPLVDQDGYAVMIAGDPGNPATAPRIDPTEHLRPLSDAVPSVVASSDVLGPSSLAPLQYLQEATLRNLQQRDPQDNVKQFLDFQHTQALVSSEVPPTPPFEIFPQNQAPNERLRGLPKLSIPGKSPLRQVQRMSMVQHSSARSQEPKAQPFVPYTMDKASPLAQDLQSPMNPYRFGTPFSEMDVPVTTVSLGPISRDVSQSVPPDMGYRAGPVQNVPARSHSRASSRRPSFPIMPPVDENRATPPLQRMSKTPSPTSQLRSLQPLRAPPRVNYPWSPIERTKPFETAIPPFPALAKAVPVKDVVRPSTQNGVTYQGPMKKRKTHFLRHEWHDGYFTLKGSRLAMHRDPHDLGRTLEYVDIDDYAIACSSLASQSKLSAAFKAVHIHHNREKSDAVGAFAFQLIPQDKQGARLRKRDSVHGPIPSEGVNGTGKTHHFAVKNRDERIDWMRELMLAKALKQKGEGFEISVNGNMI